MKFLETLARFLGGFPPLCQSWPAHSRTVCSFVVSDLMATRGNRARSDRTESQRRSRHESQTTPLSFPRLFSFLPPSSSITNRTTTNKCTTHDIACFLFRPSSSRDFFQAKLSYQPAIYPTSLPRFNWSSFFFSFFFVLFMRRQQRRERYQPQQRFKPWTHFPKGLLLCFSSASRRSNIYVYVQQGAVRRSKAQPA
jgi:hypothetical protein